MRLVTWNVNSLNARLGRVEEWIAECQPDVACLQETKLADAAFPSMAFAALGYESAHHGEGRWNGVAILSRVGLHDVVPGFADGESDDPEARLLTATCGGVRVMSAYVPNGRSLEHEHYQYKLRWLERLRRHLDVVADPTAPTAVCGDFNIAPTDLDVWDPKAVHGATHVSPPEREALGRLLAWGLADVFRDRFPDTGRLFSWWDYRAGNFHKGLGMRIDLVLASGPLARRVSWALIDRNARKGKLPSDHAPLVVQLEDEDAA
ncbi:MAG: exodeoxyribonuclease III [Acidimicrobiales bacterium]|nr:exodeoxyribonuclease III [Acidimicrobiales bacterium]